MAKFKIGDYLKIPFQKELTYKIIEIGDYDYKLQYNQKGYSTGIGYTILSIMYIDTRSGYVLASKVEKLLYANF